MIYLCTTMYQGVLMGSKYVQMLITFRAALLDNLGELFAALSALGQEL